MGVHMGKQCEPLATTLHTYAFFPVCVIHHVSSDFNTQQISCHTFHTCTAFLPCLVTCSFNLALGVKCFPQMLHWNKTLTAATAGLTIAEIKFLGKILAK
jgi:hypothetical protein